MTSTDISCNILNILLHPRSAGKGNTSYDRNASPTSWIADLHTNLSLRRRPYRRSYDGEGLCFELMYVNYAMWSLMCSLMWSLICAYLVLDIHKIYATLAPCTKHGVSPCRSVVLSSRRKRNNATSRNSTARALVFTGVAVQ